MVNTGLGEWFYSTINNLVSMFRYYLKKLSPITYNRAYIRLINKKTLRDKLLN